MLRIIALAAAALVAAGCATTPVTPTATPIAAPGTLERCDAAEQPGGQGRSESLVPGGSEESPSESYRYCLPLTLSRREGTEQVVQVGVLSDRPSDPLRDRTLLVYHPGGPGLAVVPTMMADPPPVDLARYVVLAWDGATSSDSPGDCGTAFMMDRTPADLAALATKTADLCSGGFFSANDIGAWAAAEELETIREALCVERFDLLTHSYGTAIAGRICRCTPTGCGEPCWMRRSAWKSRGPHAWPPSLPSSRAAPIGSRRRVRPGVARRSCAMFPPIKATKRFARQCSQSIPWSAAGT